MAALLVVAVRAKEEGPAGVNEAMGATLQLKLKVSNQRPEKKAIVLSSRVLV